MKTITSVILAIGAMMACTHPPDVKRWTPKRVVGMDYPMLARAARIEGKVTVVCTIGPDGSVASVKAVHDPHPILAPAALANASEWTFESNSAHPPSPESVTLVYSFEIDEE